MNADELTEILKKSGVLKTGKVVQVLNRSEQSNTARLSRLIVTYSKKAKGELPEALILKTYSGNDHGTSELEFYTRIASAISEAPVPRCFLAEEVPGGGYRLLLEDFSETHKPLWEHRYTEKDAHRIAEAFARFHAAWWDSPLLSEVGNLPTKAVINHYAETVTPGIVPMCEAYGRETLSSLQLLDLAKTHFSQIKTRAKRGNLTVIHGDPNPGNLLSPRNETSGGRIFLIDRQPFDWNLTVWTGASDLTYTMIHWWEVEDRRELETILLDHYHAELLRHGVSPLYTRQDLQEDYRLSILQSLYVAAHWCIDPNEREKMAWLWNSQLTKTLVALRDWNLI